MRWADGDEADELWQAGERISRNGLDSDLDTKKQSQYPPNGGYLFATFPVILLHLQCARGVQST